MATSQANMTSRNQEALDYFVQLPVSRDMIRYLARQASQVIRCDSPQLDKNLPPTPPASPPREASKDPELPSLEAFITSLVDRSHVQVPTLMSSLVYLARLRSRLPPMAKGMRCTVHRIFLASLILAAKNLNDSSPKNKHWARYTAVQGYPQFGFSITEVNLMEKQLLFLLDWEMRITEEDLFENLEPFLAPIRGHLVKKAEKAAARQRAEEMAAIEKQRQDALMALSTDNLRRAHLEASLYRSRGATNTPRRVYATPSRTPSLSPPTRSGSSLEHSAASSVAASSPGSTSCTTPEQYAGYENYSYGPSEVSLNRYDSENSIVHIRHPASHSKLANHHALPLERWEEKPPKKAKTAFNSAAGVFARMFSNQYA